MMKDVSWLSRTELLVGEKNIKILNESHVLIVGLGGVGSYAAEFIVRGGVGEVTIVDGDTVDPTNRNRQLPALATNHGVPKAQIMAERLKAINPELKLHVIEAFVTPDAVEAIFAANHFDYVIDAIDSITPKVTFLQSAFKQKVKIISSMGAGGKMDPTLLRVVDISQTYQCPFAQQIRKNLKNLGIRKGIKVVFSTEAPDRNSIIRTDGSNYKKSAYGTVSYLPATFGAVCSSVVIRDLIGQKV